MQLNEYTELCNDVGLALFTTLFCSQNTSQLMTASMVQHVTNLTPGSDNPTPGSTSPTRRASTVS
jgi:hypothetical protein